MTRLTLEGLTDLDIAARLEVSRHTVSNQLRRSHARLGVSSRRELGALLRRVGPDEFVRFSRAAVRRRDGRVGFGRTCWGTRARNVHQGLSPAFSARELDALTTHLEVPCPER